MTESEALDHSPMKRGKYSALRGNPKTPNQVAEIDPAYIVWAFDAWDSRPCSHLLYRECVKDIADNKQSLRVARDQDE
jgi:hypothetical protein